MRIHRWLLALAPLSMLAPALTAQASSSSPPERTGFYGMLGAAYGASIVEATNLNSANSATGTYTLTLGYMLSHRWRLGAEVDYVAHPGEGTIDFGCCNSSAVFYSASAAFYDETYSHLWLKGNLGYSTYNATYFSGNNPGGGAGTYLPFSNGGIAAGLGIGYDVRLGNAGILMAPFLSYERQLSSSSVPGVPGASARQSLLFAGLGVGFNR